MLALAKDVASHTTQKELVLDDRQATKVQHDAMNMSVCKQGRQEGPLQHPHTVPVPVDAGLVRQHPRQAALQQELCSGMGLEPACRIC